MNSFFSQQKPQKIVSSLLVVWLSGFVFLFCCGAMEVEAKGDFCPLTKAKKHCDKSESSDSAFSLKRSGDARFDCCGFLPAVYDKARKIESNQQTANVPADQVKVERPRFSLIENQLAVAGIYRPPILYQEKTFIKNCVFRI